MVKLNSSLFLKSVRLLITLLAVSRQCLVYLTEMLVHSFLSGTSATATSFQNQCTVNKTQIPKFSSENSSG